MSNIDNESEKSNSGEFLTLHKIEKPKTLLELMRMVDLDKFYFLKTKMGPAVVQFKIDFYEGFFQMMTPTTYTSTRLKSNSDLDNILDMYELDDLFHTIKSGQGTGRWK